MNPLVAPESFARDARTALSVNVNKIALLRNSRSLEVPNVVALSRTAVLAGAQGITVHPRPDERHIRTRDVHELAALLRQWPHVEYNIEGNPSHNLMLFVRELKPHQCTLVPDSETQFTSDHGYDLPRDGAALQTLQATCARDLQTLKTLLRGELHYHLGGALLRTRQLAIDTQRLLDATPPSR